MKKKLFTLVLVLVILVGFYNYTKKLPEGLNFTSSEIEVSAQSVQFLADVTQHQSNGETTYQHEIFDTILGMIDGAESFILLDMFLFNDHLGKTDPDTIYRRLSKELTETLIAKKSASILI